MIKLMFVACVTDNKHQYSPLNQKGVDDDVVSTYSIFVTFGTFILLRLLKIIVKRNNYKRCFYFFSELRSVVGTQPKSQVFYTTTKNMAAPTRFFSFSAIF